ncbi:hypothetical protein BH716_13020 [Lelliottia nimipressuralis]|nr:hypothetical protein BH716_13020 [Lelliottia nimipressuralis]
MQAAREDLHRSVHIAQHQAAMVVQVRLQQIIRHTSCLAALGVLVLVERSMHLGNQVLQQSCHQ